MQLTWESEKLMEDGTEATSRITFVGDLTEWCELMEVTPAIVRTGMVRSIEKVALLLREE